MSVAERIIPWMPTEAGSDRLDRPTPGKFLKVGLELFVSSGPGIADPKTKQKRIFPEVSRHPQHYCWCLPLSDSSRCGPCGREALGR